MTERTSELVRRLEAGKRGDMLLVEVRLDCLFAPFALFKVRLLLTFVDLVVVVSTHFDDLCTSDAVSQHFAL